MKINKFRLISFVATSFISIDIIQIFSVRVSLIPLFFYGIFILYKNKRIDIWFAYVFLFAITCVPSVIFSYNPVKSIGYIFWIIFNYIAISSVYKSLIVGNSRQTILGLRDSYRFQIIIGGVLYFSGMQFRAQVLYYEPSYFALSLIPYVVLVFFGLLKNGTQNDVEWKGIRFLDVILLIVALYTTKSANMVLVFMLAALVVSLYGDGKIKKLNIIGIAFVITWVFLTWYSSNYNDLISTTFQKIANADSIYDAILERTGNRWPRAQLTFDTAMNTFWGVGIGSFKEYTSANYFPKYAGIPAYYSPLSNEAVNIYFEIAATCGWGALIVWLSLHFKLIRDVNKYKSDAPLIVCSLVVAMFALVIESNFLRPYYWMLIGMMMGQISLLKSSVSIERERKN